MEELHLKIDPLLENSCQTQGTSTERRRAPLRATSFEPTTVTDEK